MKPFTVFLLFLCLLSLESFSQSSVYNQGNVHISSGTSMTIVGDLTNDGNGDIENEGTMILQGDLLNSGGNYQGDGWAEFAGSSTQTMTGVDSMTNLRMNSGQVLLIQNDLAVINALDLNNNGSIQLGNQHLMMLSGATLVGYDANNFIITDDSGTLQREVGATDVNFPVGNSSYNLAILNNAGALDIFSIRVVDSVLANGLDGLTQSSDFVQRTWYIDEMVDGGSDATLSLEWDTGDEQTGFDRTNSSVVQQIGGVWDTLHNYSGATAVAANTWSQEAENINSFTTFSVTSNLPAVECGRDVFEANETQASAKELPQIGVNQNALICPLGDEDWYWYVVGAKNNIHVKLSNLDVDCELEVIVGGNTTTSATAGTADENINLTNLTTGDTLFIRVYANDVINRQGYNLRLLERDAPINITPKDNEEGLVSTPVVSDPQNNPDQIVEANAIEVKLYPNPADEDLFVSMIGIREGTTTFVLYNAAGQLLKSEEWEVKADMIMKLDFSTLPEGVYFYRIQNQDYQKSGQLIRMD